ncbi:MAG: hypothetical protein FJ224_05680 [Lentisphaerae bacterium]|nr:hypothetical protein [Lentisphaerota bacterium]
MKTSLSGVSPERGHVGSVMPAAEFWGKFRDRAERLPRQSPRIGTGGLGYASLVAAGIACVVLVGAVSLTKTQRSPAAGSEVTSLDVQTAYSGILVMKDPAATIIWVMGMEPEDAGGDT